jgi:hypothetical protein
MKKTSYDGEKFGRLLLVGDPHALRIKGRNVPHQEVVCDCGVRKVVRLCGILHGSSTSCGCYRRELSSLRIKTHGESRTPLYRKWCHLFDRCKGFKERDRKNYTDKGIEVCERWMSYENFKADMGYPPKGKNTIDRIDNSKGYSPDNCRWASSREQCNNKTNNVVITYQGRSDTVANWGRHLGVCSKALMYRLKRGWSVEDAFNTPYSHANKKVIGNAN